MKTTFIRFSLLTILTFTLGQNILFAELSSDTEDTNVDESSCLDLTYYMSTTRTRSSSVTSYTNAQSTDANTEGEVSLLQSFLKDNGYMNASTLTTGRFGSLTRSAVKSFQRANGIAQTGATGPLTRTKIGEASCDESASDGDTSTGSSPSQSSSSNGTLPSGSFSFIGNTSCVAGAAGTCTITLSWPNVTAPLTTKKLKYTIAGSVTEIPLSDYSLSSKSRQFTAYADPITVVIASGTEILASATITSTCPTNLPTRSSSGGCIASSSSSASNFLLTVEKTGTGFGTITSSPSGISCGTVCTKNLSSGTSVTLTATPISPSTFTGWSGACTGTGLCNVSMVAARGVTATFSGSGNGNSGAISCGGTIPSGAIAWNTTAPTTGGVLYAYSTNDGICKYRCDSAHSWNGSSCAVASSQTQIEKVRVAVGENVVPGQPPRDQYTLGFWAGSDVSCALVSGQLPSGLNIINMSNPPSGGYSGCALAGVTTQLGVYKITWTGSGVQMGQTTKTTITKELEVTTYKPEKSLRLITNYLPEAVQGQEYSAPITIETEGDWYGINVHINFLSNPGDNLMSSYFDGGLGGLRMQLSPNLTTSGVGSSLSSFQVSTHEMSKSYSAYLVGVPKVSGSFNVGYSAGDSTAQHMSFERHNINFVIKPKIKTQAEINSSILSIVNSCSWVDTNKAQCAAKLKVAMDQNGWSFHDVVVATGYESRSLAVLLYPNTQEFKFVLDNEISLALNMFDWSDAHKQQSALAFVELMKKQGWTKSDITFFGSYLLNGPSDPRILEILKVAVSDFQSAELSVVNKGTVLGVSSVNSLCTSIQFGLRRGMESVDVTKLQNFLMKKGFLSEQPTGFYGDKTVEAVKDYQASKGLPTTGMVYDFTRRAIQEESCR